jgi:hypothetical protein
MNASAQRQGDEQRWEFGFHNFLLKISGTVPVNHNGVFSVKVHFYIKQIYRRKLSRLRNLAECPDPTLASALSADPIEPRARHDNRLRHCRILFLESGVPTHCRSASVLSLNRSAVLCSG